MATDVLNDENLLTLAELAQRLSISPSTLQRWAREGRIPQKRLGFRTQRFLLSAVVKALEKCEKEKAKEAGRE